MKVVMFIKQAMRSVGSVFLIIHVLSQTMAGDVGLRFMSIPTFLHPSMLIPTVPWRALGVIHRRAAPFTLSTADTSQRRGPRTRSPDQAEALKGIWRD